MKTPGIPLDYAEIGSRIFRGSPKSPRFPPTHGDTHERRFDYIYFDTRLLMIFGPNSRLSDHSALHWGKLHLHKRSSLTTRQKRRKQ